MESTTSYNIVVNDCAHDVTLSWYTSYCTGSAHQFIPLISMQSEKDKLRVHLPSQAMQHERPSESDLLVARATIRTIRSLMERERAWVVMGRSA